MRVIRDPAVRFAFPRARVMCPCGNAVRWCSPSRIEGVSSRGGHVRERAHELPVKSPPVNLNSVSVAVRRFLQEQQKVSPRWWKSPSHVDALLTLLLDRGRESELHPLLAVELVKRLGYAVGPDASGWVTQCGHSRSSIIQLTGYLLDPVLPLVGKHPTVRPLLPVIAEWLLSVADKPEQTVVGHVSLYVEHLSEMSAEDFSHHGWPPLEFLLLSFVRQSLHFSDESTKRRVDDIVYKMIRLLFLRDNAQFAELEQSEGCDTRAMVVANESMADCLFWKCEAPLLTHGVVRAAYARFCRYRSHLLNQSANNSMTSIPTLSVVVKDDDTLRRVLLRLMAKPRMQAESGEPMGPVSAPAVSVEVKLQLEEPSVILRFIVPLSEFIKQVLDSCTCEGLSLSFKSIQTIVCGVIGELQRLEKQSTDSKYALLPHKPRVHCLKDLCQRLLSDTIKKVQERSVSSSVSERGLCFPGVTPEEQVRILRLFRHEAHRLVRHVMKEKVASLASEGHEGLAFHAGGLSLSHSDVTTLLRNAAFRVLEASLLRYYSALGMSSSCTGGWGVTADSAEVSTAVAEIEHHAGGSASLYTARHLLQHPLRQDVVAVVEGLRLVAVQALVLRSQQCAVWLKEGGFADTVANAFFSVWERAKGKGCDITFEGGSGEGDPPSASLPVQQNVRYKLLWTMLLLHQKHCPCCSVPEQVLISQRYLSASCAVLRSFLEMLVPDLTVTEFSAFGWPYPLQQGDWDSVRQSGEGDSLRLWERQIVYPPAESSLGGEAVRWDLLDELSTTPKPFKRWLWLGTMRSVREASATVGSLDDMAARCAGYLLPWSTVAMSRHPLRFYDESGQSEAGAASFDAAVETLIRCKSHNTPLRLVSVFEETTFFRGIEDVSELPLCSGVTVINPWAQGEDYANDPGSNVFEHMESIRGCEKYDFLD